MAEQKVTRKKFPRRKKTFPLLTTRKPLIVSVEKVIGNGKRDGQRFRCQLIQQKQPFQDDNVELRVMLKNIGTKHNLEVPRQKFVGTMFVFIKETICHNHIHRRSRHVTPPLSRRALLHLPGKMKNLPVQMKGFNSSPISSLHGWLASWPGAELGLKRHSIHAHKRTFLPPPPSLLPPLSTLRMPRCVINSIAQ